MSELRWWQWELQATGAGPDHTASLSFEQQEFGELERTVSRADLPGFVRYDHQDARGAPVLTWVNESRADAFAANLSGRHRSNIWTYRMIEVQGSTLRLENGYGDWTPGDLQVQTRLLHRLLAHEPGLELVNWRIGTSDSGIFLECVAEGYTAAELLAYLRCP